MIVFDCMDYKGLQMHPFSFFAFRWILERTNCLHRQYARFAKNTAVCFFLAFGEQRTSLERT